MKNLILFFYALSIFSNCRSSEKQWDKIDFSFDNSWDVSISIKLDNQGMALIGIGRYTKDYYQIMIQDSLRKTISNKVINILKDSSLKNSYIESGEDHSHYNLIINLNESQKRIFKVIGHIEPTILSSLKEDLINIKENKNIVKLDSIVKFESIEGFYPPKPVKK